MKCLGPGYRAQLRYYIITTNMNKIFQLAACHKDDASHLTINFIIYSSLNKFPNQNGFYVRLMTKINFSCKYDFVASSDDTPTESEANCIYH